VPRLATVLPPGVELRQGQTGDEHFIMSAGRHDEYLLVHGPKTVTASSDLKVALEVLGQAIREHVAGNAPEHVFVHAGAVGYNGRAILIPGMSFSGKTTLVAELVRAGATYYSDEYAVIDEEGLVHPYAKPLSMRNGASYDQTDHAVEAFGGTAGTEPLPVGLIVVSWFGQGVQWTPRQLSTGDAVLAVLANAIAAPDRPNEPLASVTKAVRGAVTLEGPRGEAAGVARELLNTLSA
jgi:hypothetical protein